ncbi:hypothetical protein [Brunnivagina elsteri]|uniref:Lipoprotein n=1 Tax=Brunnivagina elsteri CCALA 953 TaxID=987040 RepID=A0A2A2TN87_9CYAN|nr:hypothetical protein [Calothrix elsteri]PAX59814.1 hypothetical protein CK510_04995 [Calothrix elsteri CCALA 953]
MNIKKSLVLFTVMATLTTGCHSKDEYKKFSDAGNKYTTAIESLLISAGDIRIKATSEKILANDQLSNQTIAEYKQLSETDEKRLQIINDLIQHNQLLHAYFQKLENLATSDAPERAKYEIEGITTNLSEIGEKLQATDLIRGRSLISSVANLAIDAKISGTLRKVVEKHNPLIMKELTIQQEMLKALSIDITSDIKTIKNAEEYRLVIEPLVDAKAISNKKEWIDMRQEVLSMQKKSFEFKKASETLGEFKEVYQAFLTGKTSKTNLNDFVKNVNTFIAFTNVQSSK